MSGRTPAPLNSYGRDTAVPVAFERKVSNVPTSLHTSGHELVNMDIDCKQSNGGQLYEFSITPVNPYWFPILNNTAINYTTFNFNALAFSYVPAAGTDIKGNITMGYDTQPHQNGDEDFQDPKTVANLPRSTTGTVRSPVTLVLPPSKSPKLITVPEDTSYALDGYRMGHFAMTSQGDEEKQVGQLYIDYDITFYGRKMDTQSRASAFTLAGGLITDVEPGRMGLRAAASGTDFCFCSPHYVACFSITADSAKAPGFTDGTNDIPFRNAQVGSTNYNFGFHVFGRTQGAKPWSYSGDATAGKFIFFEVSSAALADALALLPA